MNRTLVLVGLALLGTSCASDPGVGLRYRAERDLWRADWDYRNLSIRPQEAGEERWTSLADTYEAIGDHNAQVARTLATSRARRDLETIAARALFAAAHVRAMLQDSIRMERIHQRLAEEFAHVPEVAAEVAMARGQIAERSGEPAAAAEYYQAVVDRVAPQHPGAGLAGAVMELPLRIARLRARTAAEGSAGRPYQAARTYYERIVREAGSDPVGIEGRAFLAEVAADQGQWEAAIRALEDLEGRIRQMEDPPREPCAVRFAISGIQKRTGASLEAVRATLLSLLEDYPDCSLAPQVLHALASNANERGQIDEALGYLDRIGREHPEDQEAASQALLVRGKLLESHGRWAEGLEALRSLATSYPISEAALWAPLEIAEHYARENDADARATALDQAERHYRDFLSRYPPGPLSAFARERLVQTLQLQQRHDLAVTEMVALADDLLGTPGGAALLVAAAKKAYSDLADTTRAVAILERAGQVYARTRIGQWAAQEAVRLKGTMSR